MQNKAIICLVEHASFLTKREAVLSFLKQEIFLSSNLVDLHVYEKDEKYFFLNIYGVRTGRIAFAGVFLNPNKFKSYVLKKIEEYQDIVKPTLLSAISNEHNLYKAVSESNLTSEVLSLYCIEPIALASFALKNISKIPAENMRVLQDYLDYLKSKNREPVKKK